MDIIISKYATFILNMGIMVTRSTYFSVVIIWLYNHRRRFWMSHDIKVMILGLSTRKSHIIFLWRVCTNTNLTSNVVHLHFKMAQAVHSWAKAHKVMDEMFREWIEKQMEVSSNHWMMGYTRSIYNKVLYHVCYGIFQWLWFQKSNPLFSSIMWQEHDQVEQGLNLQWHIGYAHR